MDVTANEEHVFAIPFNGNPLAKWNKTWADVEELVVNLKVDTDNDADDKYLQVSKSANEITIDTVNNILGVTFSREKVTAVEPYSYRVVVAAKFLNRVGYVELPNVMETINAGSPASYTRPLMADITKDLNRA